MFRDYPKLTVVILTYLVAFGVFAAIGPGPAHALVAPLGIGGIILAGALYTYGFTAPLGAVLLVALAPDYTPIIFALLGGVGSTIADVTIFRFLNGSLHKEITRLSKLPTIRTILRARLMRFAWVKDVLGFVIISSPLPDEIGIALMTMTKMSESSFRMVDFAANVLGIYLVALGAGIVY